MQNKPNLLNAQMNVNKVSTKDYENETAFRLRENKPNQTQFQKGHHHSTRPRGENGRQIETDVYLP